MDGEGYNVNIILRYLGYKYMYNMQKPLSDDVTFTALVLFCDPLTMTVAPYIRERCLKETEMLYV